MLDAPAALDTEIQLLERRHAENPDGRFFVPLADRYRKLGNLDRAGQLLRDGLQRFPDYVSARIVLGQCLADSGRGGEAASEFRAVLSADPQNLVALRNLGRLAAAGGRREEAASWYSELLAVDPLNDDARRALHALEAEPEEAPPPVEAVEALEPVHAAHNPHFEEVFEEVFEHPPEEPGSGEGAGEGLVTETIAELYSRQGFHDRAADVYRELLRRRGEDPVLRRRLADAEVLAAGEPAPDRPATISETLAELLAWTPGSAR